MTAFTKMVLVLVVTLPVGGYVAGTLMASAPEVPRERPAIVIADVANPSPSATPKPTPRPSDLPTDDDVRVINPTPEHLDGDDDRRGRGNGGGDNSGPGGSGSDGSDDD